MNTDVLGLAVVCNPMHICGGIPDAEENCVSEEAAPSSSVHIKVVNNFPFIYCQPKRRKEEGQQAIPVCSQHSFPQNVSAPVIAGAAGGSASPCSCPASHAGDPQLLACRCLSCSSLPCASPLFSAL